MRDIVAELKALRLHGMARSYEEQLGHGGARVELLAGLFGGLLDAEVADRQARSIRYQMSVARFPNHRDLAGFDFSAAQVDETLIEQLARGEFSDAAANIVFIGGTGTGKTHLTTALGIKAITEQGKRVRFFSTVDLVNTFEQEKAAGKHGRLAYNLMHVDVVILDELGYLPFSAAGGALLFHLLSKLYERTSVIITTNLTFSEWPSGVRRREDDHRTARPAHPPLPYRRNRQRLLSVPTQHSNGQGEDQVARTSQAWQCE